MRCVEDRARRPRIRSAIRREACARSFRSADVVGHDSSGLGGLLFFAGWVIWKGSFQLARASTRHRPLAGGRHSRKAHCPMSHGMLDGPTGWSSRRERCDAMPKPDRARAAAQPGLLRLRLKSLCAVATAQVARHNAMASHPELWLGRGGRTPFLTEACCRYCSGSTPGDVSRLPPTTVIPFEVRVSPGVLDGKVGDGRGILRPRQLQSDHRAPHLSSGQFWPASRTDPWRKGV